MVKVLLYIIDTYAWVEYLVGSRKGERVKKILHGKDRTITPECCLAELKGWCLREGKDFDKAYAVVRMDTEIEPVHTDDWLEAAEIRHEMRKKKGIADFGLVDSIIVAKQRRNKGRIISGDRHFKDLKDIEYVGD